MLHAALHAARHAASHAASHAALGAALAALARTPVPAVPGAEHVRGMTISCQTWGREWGTDGFGAELDRLREIGVNWVAIHPYARVGADGGLTWRALDPAAPPEWIARPIREAAARGVSILVVPHLAHWGGPWGARSEIDFEGQALERFFADYERWITAVAACARGADAFSVASELDRLARHESRWRALIAHVRAVTSAHLTWAANWNAYEAVPFWDALDAIGVQAYFPLSDAPDPTPGELAAAWRPILARLEALHRRTGKPVVFTELGYGRSLDAARAPWAFEEARGSERARAEALQARCLETALRSIDAQRAWLRGAFVWKWFVGPAPHENFLASEPGPRAAIASVWGRARDGAR